MNSNETTPRQAAMIAGSFSIVMFVAAIVAEFFARQRLIVPQDAAQTAQNILADANSFRIGILGFLLVLICDVLVAWAFYVLLTPVNKGLSRLAAWLRLLYTAIFGMALLNLVSGFRLISMGQAALYPQALLQFNAFDDGWAIGFVFFGLHLLFIGYLMIKSGTIPRLLGALLLAAGLAYLVDSFATLTLPNYEAYKPVFKAIVAIPSIIGELGLAIWLLTNSSKLKAAPTAA